MKIPKKIEVNVYYTYDDNGKILWDFESMQDEFDGITEDLEVNYK